jgi:hypothetical protein
MESYLADSEDDFGSGDFGSGFLEEKSDDFGSRDLSYLKTPEGVTQPFEESEDTSFFSDFISKPKSQTNVDSGFAPNERSLEAINFFRTLGYSKNEAIGMTSNLAIESANFSDDVIFGRRRGDGGKAIGLAQWHPARWKDITTHLNSIGVDPYSFKGQLLAIDYELKNKEGRAMKYLSKATDHRHSTRIFNRHYERSADYTDKRENYSDKLLKYYQERGDDSYAQVGGRNSYAQDGYSFNNQNETPRLIQNEDDYYKIKNPVPYDAASPNQELLDDEFASMAVPGIEPVSKFIKELDKKGSQFIDTTKDMFKFVNDHNSNIALGVSGGVEAINSNLSESRKNQDLQNYYGRLNKKNYMLDSLEGLNGEILNT